MLTGDEAAEVLDHAARRRRPLTYDHYAWMLNEDTAPADPDRQGLARELARMNLTLNTYTQWYWKTDLHNLLPLPLASRAIAHAQYEIRVYADAMLDDAERLGAGRVPGFPRLPPGRRHASPPPMMAVLRRMLAGETVDQAGERSFSA